MATDQSDDKRDDSHDEAFEGDGAGDEIEFEDAVSELERAESKRRRWGYILGVAAVVLLAVAVVVGVKYRSWLFQPDMPIEESQRQIVKKTDDPQCRTLIAEVTNIGNTFYALEGEVEQAVPGQDLENIREVDAKLAKIEKRLDEAEALGEQAKLRFDRSREELDRWFSYVDNELRILRDVFANEIARLEAGSPAGDASAAVGDTGDAGDAAEAEPSGAAAGRSPRERRDGALVALHDAFENFRVWHSASLHPCGDADEDEEPWRPEDWNTSEEGAGDESGQSADDGT